ncbi:MAG: hypothetical protein F6K03_01740 [Kamptonema sp. SIO4C4]|nr:hypothetical protein [Kamptonema sp. SIO4C4]
MEVVPIPLPLPLLPHPAVLGGDIVVVTLSVLLLITLPPAGQVVVAGNHYSLNRAIATCS